MVPAAQVPHVEGDPELSRKPGHADNLLHQANR
jgi:hypothetical protein